MIFLQLFLSYFKIGLFNFGGGYAMLSLIQHETVEAHKWLTPQEFTDIVAISQTTPGPIGINSATYAGYTAVLNSGYPPAVAVLGSVIATVSVCLPSFILILSISVALSRNRKKTYMDAAFTYLRPTAVGLIAAAALSLVNHDNFIDLKSPLLFLAAFLLTWRYKVNPIITILLASTAGLLLY
ncbi:MAG: chromate transporter [Tannerellaceae bacterium]|jgi:chromate transporter|nr:chromate transporter [Tannerellaceae bacterium]